jgi:hypothetical protein
MKWKKENSVDDTLHFWTLESDDSIMAFNSTEKNHKIEYIPFSGAPKIIEYNEETGGITSNEKEFMTMSESEKAGFKDILKYRDAIKNSPMYLKQHYKTALDQLKFELTPQSPDNYILMCNVLMADAFESGVEKLYADYLLIGPEVVKMSYGERYKEFGSIRGYIGNRKAMEFEGPFDVEKYEKFMHFESPQFSWSAKCMDRSLKVEKWKILDVNSFIKERYIKDARENIHLKKKR